jgi:hypothetical protein
MPDLQLLDCFQPELVNLERVRFFQRQLLTADDMTADQDYFRQKLRRHNRFLHGWGVVCGLEVTAAATEGIPWRVKIDTGYALGPYGDEIYVAEPVFLDLAKCGPGAATNPCEPSVLLTNVSATGSSLFIAIKYSECVAKPVRAMPAGCGCEELACEYSRIRDSFQIECLTELPPSHQPDPRQPTLCELIEGKQLATCPPCPADPWVVLAKVPLPSFSSTEIGIKIDNFTVRRQIYSTAILQEQLIACCCKALLNVTNVRLLRVGAAAPVDDELFNWQDTRPDLSELIDIDAPFNPNSIMIEFNYPVDPDSVKDGQTFVVTELDSNQNRPGKITPSGNIVRWLGESNFEFEQDREYMVTLKGDPGGAITSPQAGRLDGDVKSQLPSGNGEEGGDFIFKFSLHVG